MIARLLARFRRAESALPQPPYACKTYRTGERTGEACTSLSVDQAIARMETDFRAEWHLPPLQDVADMPACPQWAGHRHLRFEQRFGVIA